MYSYVRATGILRESNGLPTQLDLNGIQLNRLYADYLDVVIIVTANAFPTTELQLLLADLPFGLRYVQQTFPQWLLSIGNTALPTTELETPKPQVFVTYANLWQWDWQAARGNFDFHPDHPLFPEEEKDIRLTRVGSEYGRFANKGLVTVNGFLHPTKATEYGVYVMGGGVTRHQGSDYQLGYLDFSKIAGITIKPLRPENVYRRHPDQPLREAVYINVGESLQGKTPLLSIGGWLHPLDDYYKVVGDSTLWFDFQNYPWFERFVQTKDYLDLSSFGDLKLPDGAYDQELLYSDAVIKKWFTLLQSFIILVDTPELTVGYEELADPKLTGRYYSRVKANLPLVVGNFRLADYRANKEHFGWVVNPAVYLTDNLVIHETQYLLNRGLAYRRKSTAPTKRAVAKWLRIGRITGVV